MDNPLQRVLVTGAAGFLGAWIVESFQRSGIPVRAGIRRWNSAVRLARQKTDLALCDVLNLPQLLSSLEGCDAVVHCAVGNEQVSIAGTRNVLAAARKMGIQRVVHISSVAVYGKAPGTVDESWPRNSRGNSYARQKIAAEEVCEEFVKHGLPVVTLRPTIIYGPFSQAWTVSFGLRLRSGTWGTFGQAGEGKCNLVYVTDVVQAVYRALVSERAAGETFNVNGDEIISWNEYFIRFNEMLGQDPLRPLNARRIATKARLLAPVRTAARFALTRFNRAVMNVHSQSAFAAKYMKVTESSLKLTPTYDQLKLYGVDVEYPISKARDRLGFSPQVDVTQGLTWCVEWLRQNGLVDP